MPRDDLPFEEESRQQPSRNWRFDKSISLGSILTIALLATGAFTYSNAWENRMTKNEARTEAIQKQVDDMKIDLRGRLDRIDDRLNDIQARVRVK